MLIYILFLLLIGFISEVRDPLIIYAKFYNYYDHVLAYRKCVINGGYQIEDISDTLGITECQSLTFKTYSDKNSYISGNCYYDVPITNTSYVILDIVFYCDKFGREYYGMLNNDAYDVNVIMNKSKNPRYFIS
jgi:hypothetical protein